MDAIWIKPKMKRLCHVQLREGRHPRAGDNKGFGVRIDSVCWEDIEEVNRAGTPDMPTCLFLELISETSVGVTLNNIHSMS